MSSGNGSVNSRYEFDTPELLGFDDTGPVYAVNACDPRWFESVHPRQRSPSPTPPPTTPPIKPRARKRPSWNKYF